jgi:ankyrin repeat protein
MRHRILSIAVVFILMTVVAHAAADSRISNAAMDGNRTAVADLLKQGADVNGPQGDGSTALHWAADREDLEMMQMLVRAGANVNAKTRLGDITPLLMAAKSGNSAVVDLLVKAGADTKAVSTTGTTPLMLAAASGNADAVRILLNAGVPVNAKDLYQGQTALMFAAALNRADVIKVLLERGAEINAVSLVPDPVKKNPPARANAQRSAQTQPAQPTQEGEAPPPPQNARGGARGGGVLALGGMTALQFAARDGQANAVRSLVEAGADINVPTASDRMSTLTIAVMNGHYDIAKYLLDHGADPIPVSAAGISALYMLVDAQWAAKVWYPPPTMEQEKTSYLDLMAAMLDRGADPNVRLGAKLWLRQFHGDWVDSTGATPFWRAAQADDIAGMRMLVSRGADPYIPTQHGCSPLEVAMGYGLEPQISTFVPDSRLPAAKYLIEELHADVNAKDDLGYTPLHGAALNGDNRLIEYLVAQGADVKARANQYFGRGDGAAESVKPGTGDTVADMANGPRERNLVYPETIALLVKLGSENSDYCRSAVCIIKPRPDQRKPGGNQFK